MFGGGEGVLGVPGCRGMSRLFLGPESHRDCHPYSWPAVVPILGHLLGAAVQGLPAVSGRHKATSVPGNPEQAFSGNKCHIWWER